VKRRLFVERFLVVADADPERPPGVHYDPALGLTVGPDGRPFVEFAESASTATETKSFPGDRDRATPARGEVTKVLRDKPAPPLPLEDTAVHRDRSRSCGTLVELWTNTSTRRDPGEPTGCAMRLETRVRRDPRTSSLGSGRVN
jgi:hypothetical protein